MRKGHIAGVEMLPNLSDEEAVGKCRQLFEERKSDGHYDGFEVWERARMIIQHPSPAASTSDQKPADGPSRR
jgi:hypothetical protein